MKAMIFAAGLGTRLKPLTDTLPKALVPVCGKPLIEHVARKLQAAGIDDVVVNIHYFADKVERWVEETPWIVVAGLFGGFTFWNYDDDSCIRMHKCCLVDSVAIFCMERDRIHYYQFPEGNSSVCLDCHFVHGYGLVDNARYGKHLLLHGFQNCCGYSNIHTPFVDI